MMYSIITVDLTVVPCSGAVASDEINGHLLIDNACDGLDLFSLPDHKWLKHFPIGFRVARLPSQVAFAEHGKLAVCGSDHGVVRLFKVEDGGEIRPLRHGSPGLINRVAVRNNLPLHTIPAFDTSHFQTLTTGQVSWIIAGSTNFGSSGVLTIWEYRFDKENPTLKLSPILASAKSVLYILEILMRVLFILGILLYFFRDVAMVSHIFHLLVQVFNIFLVSAYTRNAGIHSTRFPQQGGGEQKPRRARCGLPTALRRVS